MNKKGFTLVELLAVIAIIGAISIITITAVSRYIARSKTEKFTQSKKNIEMAAELYLQANRDSAPKAIGESIIIKISTLKNKNYIKDKLTNEKGEDCMKESYVRVTKLSIEEYSYKAYFICGNDNINENTEDKPVVYDFKFNRSNVKDTSFSFKMKGSANDSEMGIYSYSYSVFTKKNDNYTEVYNSGSIKGNFQPVISVSDVSIGDFIDVTGENDIRVDVTVINEGGWTNTFSTADDFLDKEPPSCGEVEGAARDVKDWINKETFGAGGGLVQNQNRTYPARIIVHCNDNDGSGCKRDKFSRTWPNDNISDSGNVNYKYGAIWSYIDIEDNAQITNKNRCYVRVNVDLRAPTIYVEVYKADSNGSPTGNPIKTITVKDGQDISQDIPQGTIHAGDYPDLSDDNWMNKTNYPNGIVMKVNVKDNLGLKTWKFETNNDQIRAGSDEEMISNSGTSTNNAIAEGNSSANGTFTNHQNINSIPKSNEALATLERWNINDNLPYLNIKRDGKRYGKLTVCDYAGNCSLLHIYANIDISKPPVVRAVYTKYNSGDVYTPASEDNYKNNKNWSNEIIKVTPMVEGDDVSGIVRYEYTYIQQKGKKNGEYTWYEAQTGVLLPLGSSSTENNTFIIKDQGTHKFTLKACDSAGNCTSMDTEDYVKVDTIKPTCDIKKTYSVLQGDAFVTVSTNPSNGSGWLKAGQRVTLWHKCSDTGDNDSLSSGCNSSSRLNKQYYKYDFDIETIAAGANGYENVVNDGDDSTAGGHVVDYAGNISEECPVTTVKIDTIPPQCSTIVSYPKGEPINPTEVNKIETGWLGSNGNMLGKKIAVVSDVCDDTKTSTGEFAVVSSGCDDEGTYDSNGYNKESYTYNSEMSITNAGAKGQGVGGTVIDNAGNITVCPADRTVKIDYSPPICTNSIEYGIGKDANNYVADNSIKDTLVDGWLGWDDDDGVNKRMARVYQVCSEVGRVSSGCSGETESKIYDYEVNTTKASAISDGLGNLSPISSIKDNAGNKAICPSDQTVKIDYTRPVCEVSASSSGTYAVSNRTYDFNHEIYNGEWIGKNAKVTLTSTCSSSESGSGNSSGCITNKSKEYSGEMSVTNATSAGVGEDFYVYDKANNRSAEACPGKTINIDTTGPDCGTSAMFYDGENWKIYNQTWLPGDNKVMVKSTCTLDNGSGCDAESKFSHEFEAQIDETLDIDGGAGDEGTPTFAFDNVGNQTVCGTIRVKIDNEPPTCNVLATYDGTASIYDGSWTNRDVKIEGVCLERWGSGCKGTNPSYVYSAAEGDIINITNGGPSEDGRSIVKDNVGNVRLCKNNVTVKIDNEAPSCVITKPSDSPAPAPQFISSECRDGEGSGCVLPDTNELELLTSVSNATYEHEYYDKAGNSSLCTTNYNVYISEPTGSVICSVRGTYYKNGNPNNSTKIIVLGRPEGSTIVFNNRGVSNAIATEADAPMKCGKTYNTSIRVTYANGTSEDISCGDYTTPSCCSKTKYIDGDWRPDSERLHNEPIHNDSIGTKHCSASCGSGTYDRSKLSYYDETTYCDSYLESGGSECESPCRVYQCRKNGKRPDDNGEWYWNLSWVYIHKKNDLSYDSNNYVDYWVGLNSSLRVSEIIDDPDPNNILRRKWKIVNGSCLGSGQYDDTTLSRCNEKFPNLANNGVCPGSRYYGRTDKVACSDGWVKQGCFRDSPIVGDDQSIITDQCAQTCS